MNITASIHAIFSLPLVRDDVPITSMGKNHAKRKAPTMIDEKVSSIFN